jgi:hypothetical protein
VTVIQSRPSLSIDAGENKKTTYKHNAVVLRVIDLITKIGTHSLSVRQLKTLISLLRHHAALSTAVADAMSSPAAGAALKLDKNSPTAAATHSTISPVASSTADTKQPLAPDSGDAALAATAAAVSAALSGPALRTDLIVASVPAPPPATRAAYAPLLIRALEQMVTRQGAHAAFHLSG